jgi:hypothetical protein
MEHETLNKILLFLILAGLDCIIVFCALKLFGVI